MKIMNWKLTKTIITLKNNFTKKFLITSIFIIAAIALPLVALSLKEKKPAPTNYALATKINYKEKKPDFLKMEYHKKKSTFIKYMLTAINNANKEICTQKKQIDTFRKDYNKQHKFNKKQSNKFNSYLEYYKIPNNLSVTQQINLLDFRAGTIPSGFVIAQAILESAWGTSRFARDYNNYFGLHCSTPSCGAKALESNVYLQVFNNATQSVLGYYNTLNSGSKFKDFRHVREKVNNKELPPSELLNTLESYSELKDHEYRDRLISVIKQNNLDKYSSNIIC